MGKLLNKEEQDFGIHKEYIIGFAPVDHRENIMYVYTDRYLKVLEIKLFPTI